MYCAGCTRLPVVVSKMKYDRNTSPRKRTTYFRDRFTDWYGSDTSMNEIPRAVASRRVMASLGPSARTPRAMKGTDHSAVKPWFDMLRLTGRIPPSNPGLRQSPRSEEHT